MMHHTTVRFGRELWTEVEVRARHGGISAAELIRTAVVAWLAQQPPMPMPAPTTAPARSGKRAWLRARDLIEEATALCAQSQLAATRNTRLRARAAAIGVREPAARPRRMRRRP
jgi:hypothetical protein